MLDEIALDTNVLVHAEGKSVSPFNQSAASFLAAFRTGTGCIVCDPQFTLYPATNTSLIGSEYVKHCPPGSVGYAFLLFLATNNRIIFVHLTRTAAAIGKWCNQNVKNKRDRTFVKLASQAQSQTLVSNDFEDFQKKKRSVIRREFGISLLTSCEALEALRDAPAPESLVLDAGIAGQQAAEAVEA